MSQGTSGEVTDLVVSVHIAASNPILPIIKVEDVIKDGMGTLGETIGGGQVSLHLDILTGKESRPLRNGEFVYVRGKRNGVPFTINSPMTTKHASRPWQFSRVSGTTGP